MARRGRRILSEQDRAEIINELVLREQLDELIARRPGWYHISPHNKGQVQALASGHKFRILIPGNGWGKTTCMAIDCDMLMQRDDPYKPHLMPDRPTTAIWYCQKYQQFSIMQPRLEEIFSKGWKWHEQKHYYQWPNGSRTFVLSGDSDWTTIQGVEIDAVYYDEHPDRKFWTEMLYRRRGEYRTRYMVAATMTQGMTWFVKQVIRPIEDWHKTAGHTRRRMLRRQEHPDTFLWNVGGIEDNPGMSEADAAHYDSIQTASEKEREVRRRGGYADFMGEAVFDREPLLVMERLAAERIAESGAFWFLPDVDDKFADRLLRAASTGRPLGHRFAGIKDRQFLQWNPDEPIAEGGRITIYEHPRESFRDRYVIGADFAYGLKGKDFDAAVVVLADPETGKVRQVAEALGHWGDVFFAETLYLLGVWFFEALICGERQVGLPAMRRLFDEMGYTHQYRETDQSKTFRRESDRLGHHAGPNDVTISQARKAIRAGDFILTGEETIQQFKDFQFKPRRSTDTMDDVDDSTLLTMGAPDREHDDLCRAGCYALHGAINLPRFVKPKEQYRPGTMGEIFKVAERLKQGGRRRPKDPFEIKR